MTQLELAYDPVTIEEGVQNIRARNLPIDRAVMALARLYKDLYELSPMSINSGWCMDFAEGLCQLFPAASDHWGNELMDETDDVASYELYGYHCFIYLDGLFYDSETPLGVDNFRDLPCFLRGVP